MPNLPYDVPYDCLLFAQLHNRSPDEDGSYADDPISSSILQDLSS